jgi:hypothetical protein
MNEKQIASANYVVSFYNEIQLLIHNYAIYLNLMLETKNKYNASTEDEEKLKINSVDKQQIIDTSQQLRYSIHKVYILVSSLLSSLKKEKDKEDIDTEYTSLSEEMVFNKESLKKYVFLCHNILTDEVMSNLLVTSQDIVNQVYQ